jgi:S-adenosylmethionine-diacylgycerolhomoserine-N-methlytransferase
MTAAPGSATEAMDGIYRYQRYIYDATRAYYLLGRDRLIDRLDVPAGGLVLEIGCGTGRNLVHAARRYPSARLYGFDISGEMLKTARASIARHGLDRQIAVAQGDATGFDLERMFGVGPVDRLFVSYALSMIPPWRDVVVAAARYLTPGTSLHVVDFGDFAGYPAVFRKAQLAWLKRFHVTPIANYENEMRRLCDSLGCHVEFEHLYAGYAVLATVTRA